MTGRMGVTTARNLTLLGHLTLKLPRTFEFLYIVRSVRVHRGCDRVQVANARTNRPKRDQIAIGDTYNDCE